MRHLCLIFLMIFVLLTSCRNTNKEINNPNKIGWEFEKLSEDRMVYINNDSTKEGMKISIGFIYPKAYCNDTILRNAQRAFVASYSDDTSNIEPKEAFHKKIDEVVKQALIYGDEAVEDFPDFSSYYESIQTVLFDTSDLSNYMTIQTQMEEYTGGAHGMHNTSYFSIDTRTGNMITEEKLYRPNYSKQLLPLIKEELLSRANSKENPISLLNPESIESNGNFYFTPQGIVYVFNTYEVAPYSDGIIEITIPYQKIKDILSNDFQFLLNKTS